MSLKDVLKKTILIGTAALSLETQTGQAAEKQSEKTKLVQSFDGIDFFNQPTSPLDQWQYQILTDHGVKNIPIDHIEKEHLTAPGLNDIKNGWGQTLLTAAVLNGKSQLVETLLNVGAQANKKNHMNQSPLYLAIIAAHGKPELTSIVEALIKKGADVNETDVNGTSLLMHAARYGDKHTIKALINGGARSSEQAMHLYQNRLDLKTGQYMPQDPKILQLLKENSCSTYDKKDNQQATIYSTLISKKSVEK